MTVFVTGATGATGRLLVEQLLKRGITVRAVVRRADRLPETLRNYRHFSITEANILDLTDDAMAQHVKGCDVVASCLGHHVSFKGIWGPPYRFVTDIARRLCQAIETNHPDKPVKYVRMNTTGNRNPDQDAVCSFGEIFVNGLLYLLLPPHTDNIKAADYLRKKIGQNHQYIEWVAVRPDGLIDEDAVTEWNWFRHQYAARYLIPEKPAASMPHILWPN